MADSRITSLLILSSVLWAVAFVCNWLAWEQARHCRVRIDIHVYAQAALFLFYSIFTVPFLDYMLNKIGSQYRYFVELLFVVNLVIICLLPVSTFYTFLTFQRDCSPKPADLTIIFFRIFSWLGSVFTLPIAVTCIVLIAGEGVRGIKRIRRHNLKIAIARSLQMEVGSKESLERLVSEYNSLYSYPLKVWQVELLYLRHYMVWQATAEDLQVRLHGKHCHLCDRGFRLAEAIFSDFDLKGLPDPMSHWWCHCRNFIARINAWEENPVLAKLKRLYDRYPHGDKNQLPRYFLDSDPLPEITQDFDQHDYMARLL